MYTSASSPHSSHPPCLSFSILRKRHKLEIKGIAVTTEPRTSIICEELDVDSGWLFTISTEVSDCMIASLVGQHKYQKLPNLFWLLCVDHFLMWEFSMSRKHKILYSCMYFALYVFSATKLLVVVLNICTCKTVQTIWYFWPTLEYENHTFVMKAKPRGDYVPLLLSVSFMWILVPLLEVLCAYMFWLEASKPEFLISAICITRSKWTPPIKYALLLLTRYKLIWNLDYRQLQHIIISFLCFGSKKEIKTTKTSLWDILCADLVLVKHTASLIWSDTMFLILFGFQLQLVSKLLHSSRGEGWAPMA